MRVAGPILQCESQHPRPRSCSGWPSPGLRLRVTNCTLTTRIHIQRRLRGRQADGGGSCLAAAWTGHRHGWPDLCCGPSARPARQCQCQSPIALGPRPTGLAESAERRVSRSSSRPPAGALLLALEAAGGPLTGEGCGVAGGAAARSGSGPAAALPATSAIQRHMHVHT